MGLTIGILAVAVIVEVGLAAYSLATRARQARLRAWVRIGMLAAFVLAALVSIIHWSIIWYLLAALLLVWAALGAWALRDRRPEKPFSAWRNALGAAGRLLLMLIVLAPALIMPQFTLPPPTGPHQVAKMNYTFTDTSRVETFTSTGEFRKVNVGCWYPQDSAEKFPLVVFSHGAFGMQAGNLSTFTNLASNGYVACSIDHPYHSLLTVTTDGRRITANPAYVQEAIASENGQHTGAEGFAISQRRLALRVADMQFVLNTLLAQAQNPGDDPVYQRIDPTRIGLFGHSLGGATSAQIARERDDIGAVIDLDGSLFGERIGYVNGEGVFNQTVFPVPFLIVYTDAMARNIDAAHDPDGLNPINRILATAPDAFEVYLPGANHMSVTDLPLISPLSVALIMRMAPPLAGSGCDDYATIARTDQLVLEFFDVYLKGQGSFSVAGAQ